MSLKSTPYYWVICDDCGVSAMESSDFTAMGDQGSAYDYAVDADWYIATHADDPAGKDYCDDCAMKHNYWYCEGCGDRRLIVYTDVNACRWCAECYAEVTKTQEVAP